MAKFWSVKELDLFYLRAVLPLGYEIHEDHVLYSHEYRYCISFGMKMVAGPFDSLDSLKVACKLLVSTYGHND